MWATGQQVCAGIRASKVLPSDHIFSRAEIASAAVSLPESGRASARLRLFSVWFCAVVFCFLFHFFRPFFVVDWGFTYKPSSTIDLLSIGTPPAEKRRCKSMLEAVHGEKQKAVGTCGRSV